MSNTIIPADRNNGITDKILKRNFICLASGRGISGLAVSAFNFAMGLYILDITGSAISFSLVLGSAILPGIIINMIAGVFVDRHDKKKIMVVSDILSGLVVFLFLALFTFYQKNILVLVLYSAFFNVIQSFFGLAINAAIPEFIEHRDVAKVNSIIQALNSACNVVGPVIGALAYKSIGLTALFIVNGLALVGSGLIEFLLVYKTVRTRQTQEGKSRYLDDLKFLFSYLKGYKILVFFFLFAVFINFMYNPLIFIVLRYINYSILKVSELQLSFIQSAAAVGMIIGALFISIKPRLSSALIKRFIILFRIQTLLILAWLFPKFELFRDPSNWIVTIGFCILLFCYGILNTFQNTPMISYFQVKVPEELRGRLFGVLFAAMFISTPFGFWFYGIILENADWGYVVIGSVILMAIASFSANKSRAFKEFIAGDDFN